MTDAYSAYPHTLPPKSVFRGNFWGMLGNIILAELLFIITLGIATPWIICRLIRWVVGKSEISGKKLVFDGRGGQLIGKMIIWTLLTIVTLGIFSFWFCIKVARWIVSHIHEEGGSGQPSQFTGGFFGFWGRIILAELLTIFTLFIGFPWAVCMIINWFVSRSVIDGNKIIFNGKGGQLFGKYILWAFLSIITLGIFALTLPIRYAKWIVGNIEAYWQEPDHGGMSTPEFIAAGTQGYAAPQVVQESVPVQKRASSPVGVSVAAIILSAVVLMAAYFILIMMIEVGMGNPVEALIRNNIYISRIASLAAAAVCFVLFIITNIKGAKFFKSEGKKSGGKVFLSMLSFYMSALGILAGVGGTVALSILI